MLFMLRSNIPHCPSVLRVAVSSDAANYNNYFNNAVWLSDSIECEVVVNK